MDIDDAPVIARRDGRCGRITLNRARALNALSLGMIHDVDVALETWRDDPDIHLVLIESASEKAFCAGGDVRTLRDAILRGGIGEVEDYFVQEYALNRVIARYNKPYVALVDGICMGGGIGLAVHGAVRVATENAVLAMPEAQLGLFPDVGASYFLPRLRGAFGMYLGLTGTRVAAADACWLGLATHFVPRAKLPGLAEALAKHGVGALPGFAEPPPPPPMAAIEADVDRVFRQTSLAGMTAALKGLDAEWASRALAAFRAASPSALAWSFELLQAGAGRTFEECQRAEVLLTRRACRHPDFIEGVRANVVDKDRKPNWQV